jgi:hypothetical protein
MRVLDVLGEQRTGTRAQRAIVAGLLDALWHVPTYERLVGPWNVPAEDATAAITWMMDQVIATVTNDQPQMPSA